MSGRVSTTQDYYEIRYVGAYDSCEKAGPLAYALGWTDRETGEPVQKIFLRPLAGGAERGVTAGGMVEGEPHFSPDGRFLLFLSNASGEAQIYVTELETGETRQITHMRYGAYSPLWSPKGDRIAFLSDSHGEGADEMQEPLTESDRAALSEQRRREAVVIEDYGYKSESAMGFARASCTHLFTVGIDGGAARRLTDGDRDHVMPAWYPDGSRVLFASNRCRPREESIGMDLYSVPAGGGEITRLTESVWVAYYPAPFQPLFTPDGETIVFGALAPDMSDGMPRTLLYTMPAVGGEARCIFPDDAPCHEATCFLYNGEGMGGVGVTAQIGANARVSPDGESLYFISGWHGACDIFRAALTGEPKITRVTEGPHCYRSLGKPGPQGMPVVRGDFLHVPRLYLRGWDGVETLWVDPNPWMDDRPLSKPEELWIDTLDADGRVQGWVFPPQNAEPGRKYPAVLYIHGGPTPFYGCALTYEHQAILGAGMGLILCNPRGSSGYGGKHQSMTQAFDGTAMVDLMQFVEEAARRFPFIDRDRLGVTGGSYGGYMTNWLISHTKRFKAAVTQRSIANDLIQYASSDMAGSSKEFESFKDFMHKNIERSAVAYADRIDVPLLILHGMDDMRCPVEHAHQLFVAVKDTHPDLPVRMVLFPKSNHSITMQGRMRLRIRHYDETIAWFQKYL